ncbi:MAG: DHA2 family efflux MFS transporter permease subunit [Pigmentiphaga sp.]|uniref:DHA2 family efflux MFS transporter permease subunit n=1 Tax=Pigmentiphaga sp. TaxID=1977564 RepID=UPI0029BF282D|nr:DHA2 family efflux MFS transporter permease subunit [Pigmentiphaga sp.]MDX3904168.1 DHA2 family efflux MFS transporter permease subunit [Pigmentiphaga sp.]
MGKSAPLSRTERIIALIVASAFFMEQLDSTIIATALPAMAVSLNADPVRMNFAMTAYLLSLAAFIPISGKIADRFGTRNTFRGAIALFVISSVLCGLAQNLPWLIAARLLQGASGAMMVPVGRLILLRSVEKSQLVTAMSWVLFPAMVGPAVGPLIGGFITTYLSWHWVFFINVPIGLAGMLLATRHIPDIRSHAASAPFDYAGFVLSATCLACIVVGLEGLGHGGVSATSLSLLAAAAACALAYRYHARRHQHPVLDFSLMRIPSFGIGMRGGFLYRAAYGSFPFLMPLMLQLGFGLSAAESGAITFAGAVGGLVMKAISIRFLRAFGYRNVMIWNGLLSVGFLALCGAFRPEWPLYAIYLMLLLGGLSRSLQFNVYGTIVYADIPPPRMSAATSLATINQQLTAALGIGLAALVLDTSRYALGHTDVTLTDFSVAFAMMASLGALAALYARRLPLDAGSELSGKK